MTPEGLGAGALVVVAERALRAAAAPCIGRVLFVTSLQPAPCRQHLLCSLATHMMTWQHWRKGRERPCGSKSQPVGEMGRGGEGGREGRGGEGGTCLACKIRGYVEWQWVLEKSKQREDEASGLLRLSKSFATRAYCRAGLKALSLTKINMNTRTHTRTHTLLPYI